MANAWFRMYAEFATDPKVQMLSEPNQRRLTMVLCLRCNSDVTLHDDEIAFQLRISNEEWSATKAIFIDKGFIDSSNNVLNWDKRQFVSDSSAERVARHRANKKAGVTKCNVTVTPPDTDTDTDTDTTVPPAGEEKSDAKVSGMSWVAFFVNEKGYQPHEAQTATTVPMFVDWVERGVTIADVELAMIAAHSKLGGGRPNNPTYYRNFVDSVMLEKQKIQSDLSKPLSGFRQPQRINRQNRMSLAGIDYNEGVNPDGSF